MTVYSIGRPQAGHYATTGRFGRGRSMPFGRPGYGTTIRCSCGWRSRSNEAPSQGGYAGVNAMYRAHIVETCPDHWHCDPALAAHICDGSRALRCPTCGSNR